MSNVRIDEFSIETRDFFRGRRVLVLGGSGFVGSHVVEQLLALGAIPIVLTRSAAPRFLAHLVGSIEIVTGDLLDSKVASIATRQASVVLNLAADVAGIAWNKAHPASMFMNNMDLFFSSLRIAAECNVDRYLVTSSACVYPRHCTIPTPEHEGFLDEPEPTNAGYGWAKRMEEFLGRAAVEEYGLSVAIARPYNCYGPRDDFAVETSHVIPSLIHKALSTVDGGEFSVWGDGSHSRGFLYVDDFSRGLLEVAARHAKADPLNLGADGEVSIAETAQTIADAVRASTGRLVRPRYDESGIVGQPRRSCDTSKAEEILQFKAKVPLAEGIARTIDWYLKNAHNPLHIDA